MIVESTIDTKGKFNEEDYRTRIPVGPGYRRQRAISRRRSGADCPSSCWPDQPDQFDRERSAHRQDSSGGSSGRRQEEVSSKLGAIPAGNKPAFVSGGTPAPPGPYWRSSALPTTPAGCPNQARRSRRIKFESTKKPKPIASGMTPKAAATQASGSERATSANAMV